MKIARARRVLLVSTIVAGGLATVSSPARADVVCEDRAHDVGPVGAYVYVCWTPGTQPEAHVGVRRNNVDTVMVDVIPREDGATVCAGTTFTSPDRICVLPLN